MASAEAGTRRLQGGDDFNSSNNFRFEEKIDVSFKTMNYTYAVDAFKTGLDSIEVIFNHGDHREMLEEEMYLVQGKQNDSIRTLDLDDTKSNFNDQIEDSFLLFQLTTTYIDPVTGKEKKRVLQSKDPRVLQEEGDDATDDSVESTQEGSDENSEATEGTAGADEESTAEDAADTVDATSNNTTAGADSQEEEKKSDFYYPFEAHDFADSRATERKDTVYLDKSHLKLGEGNDLFTVFPTLKVEDGVYLMGDYFSTDYSQLKAYTELEIKIDFYEVIKEALKRTHDWKTSAEDASGKFKW